MQRIPFFVTISRNLKLTTEQMLNDRRVETILEFLDNVVNIYKNRGFEVKTLLMDGEFIPMMEDLKARGITGNPTSKNEHVPEVKRQIRVIKERVREIYNTLPYTTIPKIMMKELVYYVVTWLNNFPPKGGISKTITPRQLFTGDKVHYNRHCKIQFGEYVQVHEENTPTNSMEPRATGASALGSTYNLQSGYKFLSLNTGRLINRRAFTILPLKTDVKSRVESLGQRENRPNKLFFHDRNEEEELEEEMEDRSQEEYDDEASVVSNDGNIPGVDEEYLLQDEEHAEDDTEGSEQEDKEQERPVTTKSGRIINKPKSYIPSFSNKKYAEINNLNMHISETIEYDKSFVQVFTRLIHHQMFHQYSLKEGLKVFGERGRIAAFKEMEQLHLRNCFRSLGANELSTTERKKVLESLIFLKEKDTGEVKGRAVADGQKQHEDAEKGAATSPTVHLESIMLTAVIDTKENRDIAIINIPNAFI